MCFPESRGRCLHPARARLKPRGRLPPGFLREGQAGGTRSALCFSALCGAASSLSRVSSKGRGRPSKVTETCFALARSWWRSGHWPCCGDTTVRSTARWERRRRARRREESAAGGPTRAPPASQQASWSNKLAWGQVLGTWTGLRAVPRGTSWHKEARRWVFYRNDVAWTRRGAFGQARLPDTAALQYPKRRWQSDLSSWKIEAWFERRGETSCKPSHSMSL